MIQVIMTRNEYVNILFRVLLIILIPFVIVSQGKCGSDTSVVSTSHIYIEDVNCFEILVNRTQSKGYIESVKIGKPIGTGQTTGHIASIPIENLLDIPVAIESQSFYIPSNKEYQPYVGRIKEGIIIPPGTTISVQVVGYCTDINLPPVPLGSSMPDLVNWIPVSMMGGTTAVALVNASETSISPEDQQSFDSIDMTPIRLIPGPDVSEFTPELIDEIVNSDEFIPGESHKSGPIMTWPGTDIVMPGIFDMKNVGPLFAGVVVKTMNIIEDILPNIQADEDCRTPFSADSLREADAIVQQTIWIYTAGGTYGKEEFSDKIYSQYKTVTGKDRNKLKKAVKEKLELGVDDFFNSFMATGLKAKIFNNETGGQGVLVSHDAAVVIEPPWDWIELTGTYMKPEIPVLMPKILKKSPKIKKKFPMPWWMPVSGWAVAGGVTNYLISQKKKNEAKQQSLITLNDHEVIECGSTGILLDVLENDQGTELTVISIDNVIGGEVSIQQNSILVSNPSDQSVRFEYTVQDRYGNIASAEGIVQVNSSSLLAEDDQYKTTQLFVEGNLLDNDLGSGIEIVHNESPSDGELVITADGQFSYTASNSNVKRIQFLYVIADKCNNRDTAICVIDVRSPLCNMESSFETTPAQCGRADGRAIVKVTMEEDYQVMWPDGNTLVERSDLAVGIYDVVVTSEYCQDSLSIEIDEKSPQYDLQAVGVPGNCEEGGDIEMTFDQSLDGDFVMAVTGPVGVSEYTIGERSAVALSDYTTVLPGSYTIELWNALSGKLCSQAIQVSVPDNTPELVANNDAYSTEFLTAIDINVLSNDMGWSLVLTDINEVIGGQVVTSEDGQVVFTPEEGFSGEASFRYTVTDGCGQEKEAQVFIEVGEPDCTMKVDFSVQTANCGQADGSAIISVSPVGNYMFSWPDGSTLSERSDLVAGFYEVVIASEHCRDTVLIEIKDEPADYSLQGVGLPGNCVEEGDIELTFDNSLDGDLVIDVEGPSGTGEYTTSERTSIALSDYITVLPGSYTVEIWNSLSGRSCSQSIQVMVPDNTPELIAENDTYSTGFMTAIEFNVLSNDKGLGLVLSEIKEVLIGQVDYSEDGKVIYTPEDGFSGETSFRYKVIDVCGREVEAQVTIVVEEIDCTMTAEFVTQHASCGKADGSSLITISPVGDYQYTWSDGSVGSELMNVAPGIYSVNVRRVGTTCQKSFEVGIGEQNANYIADIQVTPINCTSLGEIAINLNIPPGEQLDLVVNYPGGNYVLSTTFSQINLSAYIPIDVGKYTITVNSSNTGTDCQDKREVLIEDIRDYPEIELTAESPPSSPSSADGYITGQISGSGDSPYRLFLNGQSKGLIFGSEFNIGQIGYGQHTVYILDLNGCKSNVAIVNFEPNGLFQFQLETGYVTSYLPVHQSEYSDKYDPYLHLSTRLKGVYNYRNHFVSLSAGYGMAGFAEDRILERFETTFSKGVRKNWLGQSISIDGGVVFSTVNDLQHLDVGNQQYGVFLGSIIHGKKTKSTSGLIRFNFEGFLFLSDPLYPELRCSIGF